MDDFVQVVMRGPVFGYATNTALRTAKQANVGLRDQRAAFECEQQYAICGPILSVDEISRDPRQYRGFRRRPR